MSGLRIARWLTLTATIITASPAAAQRPGKPLIDQVATAMGGKEKVLAVRTLVLEGIGREYNFGQNKAPAAPLDPYEVTTYRRAIDFANRRWRQELTREPRFPTGNPAPQQLRIAYDSVAFDIGADGTPRRSPARADIDRASQLILHPIGFMQAALASGTELTEEARIGGLRHVRMNVAGDKFAILIDPGTKLPTRIHKITHDGVLGDVLMASQLSEWKRVEGVMQPMRIRQRLDDRLVSDLRFSSVRPNADVGDLASPTSVRSVTAVVPPVNVTGQLIAPGVWYLAGQTHHSVVIEMRDHLILVEAPQSDARTIAVMQRARTLGNGKPLRTVISTHHHFDHIGGLRAAIAEGLTVITQSKNKAFVDSLARRQRTIVPDALSAAPRPAQVQGVATKLVLSDSVRTVEIHSIRGSPHAETLLMVYLPTEKLLIEADVYTPPAADAATPPRAPFAANLVENIDRLGLQVDYIVPLHGRVVPMADLRKAAEASQAPPPG
jgi:glyoxylase-like metal-dependent hydrolase (beta-lactamase superfamily II)